MKVVINESSHYCPDGVDSWCKYNRALAEGREPPHANTLIPCDYAANIQKVFEDLCDDTLLERCLLGVTQNRNESFNSLVWSRCSKTDFSGKPTVQIAVSCSVLAFNSGKHSMTNLMETLGMTTGPLCLAYFDSRDKSRLSQASYVEASGIKRRRKAHRRQKQSIEEHHVEEEGVTYEAGGY